MLGRVQRDLMGEARGEAGTRATPWSGVHTCAFAATVLLMALVPWSVSHWPSQDGQNHLAVAHVVMHYDDPGSSFSKYLSVQGGFRPTTAVYWLLRLGGTVASLQTVEKGIVSLALVLLPLSLWLFVRRTVPHRAVNVMLCLPLLLGWAFGMGFLSFQIALALGLSTLWLAWEPPGSARATGLRLAGASACFAACVWFHPVVSLTTVLAMGLLEWNTLLRPARWRALSVVFGPGLAFLVGAYVAGGGQASPSSAGADTHFADPATVLGSMFLYNVAYTPWELVPRIVVLALLVRFAWSAIRTSPPLGSTTEAAIARLLLGLLLLYVATPETLHGWGYASTRFFLFALLLLPAAAEFPARVARRLVALGPALAVAVLAVQWPSIRGASRQMQDILDVGASVRQRATLVPIDFTASVLGPQPLGHAWSQLVVERDAIAPQLFAAGKPLMGGERFRTLSFRPGLLDVRSGALPWSSNEGWHDVRRACDEPGSPARWFVAVGGTCEKLLAERKESLDAVIDRYDYVLMLEPPPYGRDLVAPRARLVSHVGSAWLYAVEDREKAARM